MRSLSFIILAAWLLLFSIACHSASHKELASRADHAAVAALTIQEENKSSDSVAIAAGNVDEQPSGQTGPVINSAPPKGQPATSPAAANPDWDKKIIKTADINLEVKNFKPYSESLKRMVRSYGGYLAQEEENSSNYKIENAVVIKVPVSQFDDMITHLASDSDKMVEKKISSQDVTMEMVDTKSRMETKREMRERYLTLLKQARNISEVLKVQHEIDEIQEDMEAASGRIAYLQHSSAYSTINLRYFQILDPGAVNEPSPSFLHKLKDAFTEGWGLMGQVLIGLISTWPLWLAAVLIWMVIRKWRSRTKSKLINVEAKM
jgi:hypothetical protein